MFEASGFGPSVIDVGFLEVSGLGPLMFVDDEQVELAANTLTLDHSSARQVEYVRTIVDSLVLTDRINQEIPRSVLDTITFSDDARRVHPESVSQGVTFAQAVSVIQTLDVDHTLTLDQSVVVAKSTPGASSILFGDAVIVEIDVTKPNTDSLVFGQNVSYLLVQALRPACLFESYAPQQDDYINPRVTRTGDYRVTHDGDQRILEAE